MSSQLVVFHLNVDYLRTAAETPASDDLRMVDIFGVLKTIQAANSKILIYAIYRADFDPSWT